MFPIPGVTKEQIARAKEIPILDYVLAHEPDNVRKLGNEYRLKDHSVTMSNGKWHWQSHGVGGEKATALNYLITVRGYSFVDAVRHLTGDNAIYTDIIPKSRAPSKREYITLPPRNRDYTRVVAYLQRRGIDKALILDCIKRGLIYESEKLHNCVFVGRDESGKARFAAQRGTSGDFKCDAAGSDKRFGFRLPPLFKGSDTVAVFESPIDALSHATLHPDFNGWRLALGGTALVALKSFLERHNEINRCVVCTDNDKAGNLAAVKIAELLAIEVIRSIPPIGKDWNNTLLSKKGANPLEDVRKDILFLEEPFTYPEAFRIKDGESVKMTYGYDGEVATLKCRFIDEVHLTLGSNTYHISELSEILQRGGSTVEPIPDQKPMLDIIAAKYGEPLKDAVVPMSENALKELVGGDYTTELLKNHDGKYTYGVLLSGKDGMAVCGVGGENNTPTSLHPYWAQKYMRELSTEPPKKESLHEKLDRGKEKAAQQTSHGKGRSAAELV